MVSSKELLTIGYSTLASRSTGINYLSSVQNLLVVQNPNSVNLPPIDQSIVRIEIQSTGVAKSRNTVIDHTKTKYLLFGDDDIIFNEESVNAAISYLEMNPEISILLMQAIDESGNLRKRYPEHAHALKLVNSAKAATYEMMIRVGKIKESGVRFDEHFGAGVENYLGDEYIFIADALRAGLKGTFLPIVIATHPTESSGSYRKTKEDAIVRSHIFGRVFGIYAPIMRLLFVLKHPAEKFGFRNLVAFLIGR